MFCKRKKDLGEEEKAGGEDGEGAGADYNYFVKAKWLLAFKAVPGI